MQRILHEKLLDQNFFIPRFSFTLELRLFWDCRFEIFQFQEPLKVFKPKIYKSSCRILNRLILKKYIMQKVYGHFRGSIRSFDWEYAIHQFIRSYDFETVRSFRWKYTTLILKLNDPNNQFISHHKAEFIRSLTETIIALLGSLLSFRS